MGKDVFLSYSSRDDTPERPYAQEVLAALRDRGLSCWFAPSPDDNPPGEEFAEAIFDGLKECAVAVLVFTANANTSLYVKKEMALAVKEGLPILVLRREYVEPSGSLGYYLCDLTWLEAWQDRGTDWRESLVKVVKRHLPAPLTFPLDSTGHRDFKVAAALAVAQARWRGSQVVQLTGLALYWDKLTNRFLKRPWEVKEALEDLREAAGSGVLLSLEEPYAVLPVMVREDTLVVLGLAAAGVDATQARCREHLDELARRAAETVPDDVSLRQATGETKLPGTTNARRRSLARFLTELAVAARIGPPLALDSSKAAKVLPAQQVAPEILDALEMLERKRHEDGWLTPRPLGLLAAASYLKGLFA